ncbi:MAG TPA: zinc ribbon domain-containing protein [Ignavibacteriaceae bacterium]|jgi:NADH:ubiquinone oxidoreductase subunit 6 (subunit J)|nr:MAG: hypothetical protein BWY38_01280 [Ignavibacteria bacterium ADurb.Bin266]OQY75658.1 MAG: hypothetical protein B6D44_01060 [Ignavibacteriales bacterium UTCHB2]HQF42540.1 zinc ribbon domain-containing protein [Ignavibacteriaceae bacterium]HQI40319.1 zinc ribbon domain-containing protein [Ignavibacteriaceae bacterium]
MFCWNCGKENPNESNYCINCGSDLHSNIERKDEESSRNTTYEVLILVGWFLSANQIIFFLTQPESVRGLSIIVELGTFIMSIVLINTKNKTSKTNGWIILCIWIFIELIGLMAGFMIGFMDALMQ